MVAWSNSVTRDCIIQLADDWLLFCALLKGGNEKGCLCCLVVCLCGDCVLFGIVVGDGKKCLVLVAVFAV